MSFLCRRWLTVDWGAARMQARREGCQVTLDAIPGREGYTLPAARSNRFPKTCRILAHTNRFGAFSIRGQRLPLPARADLRADGRVPGLLGLCRHHREQAPGGAPSLLPLLRGGGLDRQEPGRRPQGTTGGHPAYAAVHRRRAEANLRGLRRVQYKRQSRKKPAGEGEGVRLDAPLLGTPHWRRRYLGDHPPRGR
jgi:hypothetical protein